MAHSDYWLPSYGFILKYFACCPNWQAADKYEIGKFGNLEIWKLFSNFQIFNFYKNHDPIQVSLTPLPARFLLLLDFSILCLISVMGIMIIRKINVSGGIPIMDTHLPPKYLRIGLFSLSAIRYILGRMNSVMKKANASPKMIVQDNGFQKTALSPPKKICGLRSAKSVTKLILNPIANVT